MHLRVKIIGEESILNEYYTSYTKKHLTDSGFDLVTPRSYLVPAHSTVRIKLGICCEVVNDYSSKHGYYLYPRSSISNTPLRLANSVGIIDDSYRGEIMATVDNIAHFDYTIKEGTLLFQLCSPDLKAVTFELVDELTDTERGSGGFGSTTA